MTRTGTFVGKINIVRHLMRSSMETECGQVGELREAGEILKWSFDLCDGCIRRAAERREQEAAA